MASSSGGGEDLTPRQIVRLAACIPADNMAAIAEGYMNIEDETIKNLQYENRGQAQAFNREIIKFWVNTNPGPNKAQKLAAILYEAAEECSYVDPHKVETILGFTKEKAAAQTTTEAEISEAELIAIAEELKPYTEEAMKIDTAPWVKACTEVDMDKLYTELSLERLENQVMEYKGTPIRDYKEIFEDISLKDKGESSTITSNVRALTVEEKARKTYPRRRKGKKILLKGDPGVGKTTLMKKIGWDWAKGFFTTFSIVFFVFLKLVESGEVIENIIVRHTPALEGLTVQEKRYFRTVGRVQGFGHIQAKEFASKILNEESKIDEVMSFTPSRSEHLHTCPIIFLILCVLVKEDEIDLQSKTFSNGELYFRLVRCLYKKYTVNKGIDYEDDAFVELLKKLGKLAWETLREGNALLRRSKVIKEIGEEAFDYGILIGNEDFRLIAKEAADILVSFAHRTLQDFLGSYHFVLKLSEGESIESLLGSDCKVPRFMLDSLFLHFCLWFCFSDQKYISFPNRERCFEVLRSYVLECLNVVQFEPQVIKEVFPACDIRHALTNNDSLRLDFLSDILAQLHKVKVVMLKDDDPIDCILMPITDNLKHRSMSMVAIVSRGFGDMTFPDDSELGRLNWVQFVKETQGEGDISIVLVGFRHSSPILHRIMRHYVSPNLLFSVYLFSTLDHQRDVELSEIMLPNVSNLYIVKCPRTLKCDKDISPCKFLKKLYFVNNRWGGSVSVQSSVVSRLSSATAAGNLPNLTHLCFDNCLYLSGVVLTILLQSAWSALTWLNLSDRHFDVDDFIALSSANKRGLLPMVKSLIVCDLYKTNESAIKWLFKHPWPKLATFRIDNLTSYSGWELTDVFKQGKMKKLTDLAITAAPNQMEIPFSLKDDWPQLMSFKLGCAAILVDTFASISSQLSLQKLDLSFCGNITNNVSSLLSHGLPLLNTLILEHCNLVPEDLSNLGRACVKGAVPNLRHLDISSNIQCAGHLEPLFDTSCLWNDLLSLDFTQLGIHKKSQKRDLFARDLDVLCSKIENGFLSSLEELSFTAYTSSYPSFKQTVPWKHVRKINILDSIKQYRPDIAENLRPIVDMVEGGMFPSLEVVSYVPVHSREGGEQEMYKLAKSNVRLFIIKSRERQLLVLPELY